MSTWFFFLTMLTNPGSCQSVSGERIFATDLSRALPEFLALPKDTIIGYAPVPVRM